MLVNKPSNSLPLSCVGKPLKIDFNPKSLRTNCNFFIPTFEFAGDHNGRVVKLVKQACDAMFNSLRVFSLKNLLYHCCLGLCKPLGGGIDLFCLILRTQLQWLWCRTILRTVKSVVAVFYDFLSLLLPSYHCKFIFCCCQLLHPSCLWNVSLPFPLLVSVMIRILLGVFLSGVIAGKPAKNLTFLSRL